MLIHNRWFFLQFTWTGEGSIPRMPSAQLSVPSGTGGGPRLRPLTAGSATVARWTAAGPRTRPSRATSER